SRVERRIHKGNWCNPSGAGLGDRPRAAPATGIDAYVWIKPPGESDGSSSLIPTGPENPGGKGFDRMCDPTYTGNSLNGNNLTGALANAPVSGRWFMNQFIQLVQNAFPPFTPSTEWLSSDDPINRNGHGLYKSCPFLTLQLVL